MNRLLLAIGIGALLLGGCDSGTADGGKPKAAANAPAKDGGKPAPVKAGDAPSEDDPKPEPTTALGDEPDDPDDPDEAGDAAGADGEAEVLAALDKRVLRVAKLAKEIENKPADAEAILTAADIDRAAFEALVYEIGEDETLSQQYRLAMAGDDAQVTP